MEKAHFSLPRPEKNVNERIRVAVIGGGIAGVTAAHALAMAVRENGYKAEITVFEASKTHWSSFTHKQSNNGIKEEWTAATNLNANTLVLGSALSVLSQRSKMFELCRDVALQWRFRAREALLGFKRTLTGNNSALKADDPANLFASPPPYFSLAPVRLLGPRALPEERWAFLAFARHFARTALRSNHNRAYERDLVMVTLASASRASLLNTTPGNHTDVRLFGLTRGFVSLHRSSECAHAEVADLTRHGEPAVFMGPSILPDSIALQPRLHHFHAAAFNGAVGSGAVQSTSFFTVSRPDDLSANCVQYTRDLAEEAELRYGVQFRLGLRGRVTAVDRIPPTSNGADVQPSGGRDAQARFRIHVKNGEPVCVDAIILAAGADTPVLVRRWFGNEVGRFCPTFPMRGHSLTLSPPLRGQSDDASVSNREELLMRPMSVDRLYCSSTIGGTARLAGFGEFVGFREGTAVDAPSAAPQVLVRYARALFPELVSGGDLRALEASVKSCFRPMSPDDLPVVGEISCAPGLFLHTGHGMLGWTLSAATAACIAQAVTDSFRPRDSPTTSTYFALPGGKTVLRSLLSLDRFG